MSTILEHRAEVNPFIFPDGNLHCTLCNSDSWPLWFHYVSRRFSTGYHVRTLHSRKPLLCFDCAGKHDCCVQASGAYCEVDNFRRELAGANADELRLYIWICSRMDGFGVSYSEALPNEAKRYVSFSKQNFLDALKAAGLEGIEEVEPRWTRNRVGIEVCESRFLGRIPAVKGYLLIGSSVDPESGYANGNSTDRITLKLKSRGDVSFRRLNRVQNWRINLSKAIEGFKKNFDSSNSPTTSTPSNQTATSFDSNY